MYESANINELTDSDVICSNEFVELDLDLLNGLSNLSIKKYH